MNWYKNIKQAYNRGISRMDEYTERRDEAGLSPKEKDLVQRADPMGGNERDFYPSDLLPPSQRENTDRGKLNKHLPGSDHENPLMDQDPPTGEGANDQRFTSDGESNNGEGYADKDKIPETNLSRKVDRGPAGPHNMHDVFRNIKKQTGIRGGLNLS